MKRSLSILLITVLLFNVLGYYGIFIGLRYKNTRQLIEKLNSNDYRDQETITIKIPLTMPYGANSNGYQRIDGEFEFHGKMYRLVKQLYQRDTLFVVCINDSQGKQINEALREYAKTLSDKHPASKTAHTKFSQNFIKDYIPSTVHIERQYAGWIANLIFSSYVDSTYQYKYTNSIPHPPQG